MRASNTRAQDGGRPTQSDQSSRPAPSLLSLLCCCGAARMPSKFNILRGCLYVLVLRWTIVCLAIAVHLQNILISSDLTRFVPFAIFVASASLLILIALLGFGLWKDRNPISTRVELGCLGLLGVLWLALGAFLGSSDSGDSDVECFSSADATEPVEMPGFNTETFHAQYRVLEAFSFFNIILLWAFLLMLLFLAIRHHRYGNRHVWVSSVTAYPWFGGADAQTGKLPAPATAKRSTSTRSQPPLNRSQSSRTYQEKLDAQAAYGNGVQVDISYHHSPPREERGAQRHDSGRRMDRHDSARRAERQDSGRRADRRDEREQRPPAVPEKRPSQRNHQRRPSATRRDTPTKNEAPTYVYMIPHTQPEPARTGESARQVRDKYLRDASPRR